MSCGLLGPSISCSPAPPQPTEDELDLDREIEYAFDVEEPMAGRAPTGDVE
jgi:hypothetical protein